MSCIDAGHPFLLHAHYRRCITCLSGTTSAYIHTVNSATVLQALSCLHIGIDILSYAVLERLLTTEAKHCLSVQFFRDRCHMYTLNTRTKEVYQFCNDMIPELGYNPLQEVCSAVSPPYPGPFIASPFTCSCTFLSTLHCDIICMCNACLVIMRATIGNA